MRTLERFAGLAAAMGAAVVDPVATAAVREASNGPAFVARVRAACGLEIEVVSGAREAELAAMGVLAGFEFVDGVLGDLGGGSLEMAAIDDGAIGPNASLPV